MLSEKLDTEIVQARGCVILTPGCDAGPGGVVDRRTQPRTENLFPHRNDQGRSGQIYVFPRLYELYDLAHVAGWDPSQVLSTVAHVS